MRAIIHSDMRRSEQNATVSNNGWSQTMKLDMKYSRLVLPGMRMRVPVDTEIKDGMRIDSIKLAPLNLGILRLVDMEFLGIELGDVKRVPGELGVVEAGSVRIKSVKLGGIQVAKSLTDFFKIKIDVQTTHIAAPRELVDVSSASTASDTLAIQSLNQIADEYLQAPPINNTTTPNPSESIVDGSQVLFDMAYLSVLGVTGYKTMEAALRLCLGFSFLRGTLNLQSNEITFSAALKAKLLGNAMTHALAIGDRYITKTHIFDNSQDKTSWKHTMQQGALSVMSITLGAAMLGLLPGRSQVAYITALGAASEALSTNNSLLKGYLFFRLAKGALSKTSYVATAASNLVPTYKP